MKPRVEIGEGVPARLGDDVEGPPVAHQTGVDQGEDPEVRVAVMRPVRASRNQPDQVVVGPAVMTEGLEDLVAATLGGEGHGSGRLRCGDRREVKQTSPRRLVPRVRKEPSRTQLLSVGRNARLEDDQRLVCLQCVNRPNKRNPSGATVVFPASAPCVKGAIAKGQNGIASRKIGSGLEPVHQFLGEIGTMRDSIKINTSGEKRRGADNRPAGFVGPGLNLRISLYDF